MITEFHIQQLWLLMNGEKIARPARRKLEKSGMLFDGKPTQKAIDDMVRLAPRSKWSPPKPVERTPGMPQYNRRSIGLMGAMAIALSVKP